MIKNSIAYRNMLCILGLSSLPSKLRFREGEVDFFVNNLSESDNNEKKI